MKISEMFSILIVIFSIESVIFNSYIFLILAMLSWVLFILIDIYETKISKNKSIFFYAFERLKSPYIVKQEGKTLQVCLAYHIPVVLVEVKINLFSVRINFKDGWAKNVTFIFKIKNLTRNNFDYFLFGQLDQIQKE